MARVRNFTLRTQLNGGVNGTVTAIVDYDIDFSDLDRLANIRYREVATQIGDDTNIAGDVANGGDDELAVLLNQITATDGQQTVHRHLERTISRSTANEDRSILAPKDELRAEVSMRDVQNQVPPVFAEGNLVEGRF